MNRVVEFLSRHCRLLAILCLCSAVIPALLLPSTHIDNSIEVWLDRTGEDYAQYRQFLARYGSEEFVVIGLPMEDPLSADALVFQQKLADRLAAIDGVDDVLSVPRIIATAKLGPAGREALRTDEFLRGYLLGPGGHAVGLVVRLPKFADPGRRQRVVGQIESALAEVCGKQQEYHLAGLPVMTARLNRAAISALTEFLLIAGALAAGTLLLCLRSFRGMAVVMAAVGVTVLWTMGILVLSGRTINMITAALPTLLFVMALSNGIHLALEYQASMRRGMGRERSLRHTYRTLLAPATLTSVTTAVGFGSLLISHMSPVQETGLFAAIGICIGCVCDLLIVPGLLGQVRPSKSKRRRVRQHWSAPVAAFVARRPWPVTIAALAVLAFSTVMALRLRGESNVLAYFPKNSRVVKDYRFIGERLTGFYTVELDVGCPPEDAAATLAALDRVESDLADCPHVVRIDHAGRLEKMRAKVKLSGWLGGAGMTPELAKLLDGMEARLARRDTDGQHYRLSVLTNAMAASDFYPVVDRISESAGRRLGASMRWKVTGIGPLMKDAEIALIATQLRSFPLATAVVLLLIGVLYRSVRAFAASVLPNLLPIVGTFSMMALIGVPLDPATVMIASIAIGLAVDNTIHFLARYRTYRLGGQPPVEAAALSFGTFGRAAVFTSLVAAAGFGVLAMSEFRPVALFGTLSGLTIVCALLADMLVLPPSVRLFGLWNRPTGGPGG
ncbi:MAG: hypothetical protein BIFFINMI_01041 [Phycisphaerae bacterium]|nr:hypothetical protein [Phycisphaerae bacterium]